MCTVYPPLDSKLQPIRVLIVETKRPIRSQEISKFWRVINERILTGPKKAEKSRIVKIDRIVKINRIFKIDIQF